MSEFLTAKLSLMQKAYIDLVLKNTVLFKYGVFHFQEISGQNRISYLNPVCLNFLCKVKEGKKRI